jgi:recombination associated protein RdgC
MPVLHGAVTFARFQIENPDPKRTLGRTLKAKGFEPIDRSRGADAERSAGFVELENHDSTEFPPSALYSGEHALFGYRIDTLKVSASALKAELGQWLTAFEAENGRRPSRAEKNKQRDLFRDKLRSTALPTTQVHDVSWELKTGRLQVWASSRKAIDEVQTAFEEAFELKLLPLVPTAIAARQGIPEEALLPTPALVGGGLESEVQHGEA